MSARAAVTDLANHAHERARVRLTVREVGDRERLILDELDRLYRVEEAATVIEENLGNLDLLARQAHILRRNLGPIR